MQSIPSSITASASPLPSSESLIQSVAIKEKRGVLTLKGGKQFQICVFGVRELVLDQLDQQAWRILAEQTINILIDKGFFDSPEKIANFSGAKIDEQSVSCGETHKSHSDSTDTTQKWKNLSETLRNFDPIHRKVKDVFTHIHNDQSFTETVKTLSDDRIQKLSEEIAETGDPTPEKERVALLKQALKREVGSRQQERVNKLIANRRVTITKADESLKQIPEDLKEEIAQIRIEEDDICPEIREAINVETEESRVLKRIAECRHQFTPSQENPDPSERGPRRNICQKVFNTLGSFFWNNLLPSSETLLDCRFSELLPRQRTRHSLSTIAE